MTDGAFSVRFKETGIGPKKGEKQRWKGSDISTLLVVRDKILADRKVVIAALIDCTALKKKAEMIGAELAAVADRIEQLVKSNRAVGTILLCSNNHSHAASSK